MRVLFLENQDSFSWTVVECRPVEREAVIIRRGREAAGDPDALRGVRAVVIGPGPTDPVRAGVVDIVRRAAAVAMPLLGICLGHQALGLAYGARLARAEPRHGKQSVVEFRPSRLFAGVAGPHVVMCYNSLVLEDVPAPLRVVAETAGGVPMAIEHESLPMAGLQFHPDSFATPRGRSMVAAFFEAVR